MNKLIKIVLIVFIVIVVGFIGLMILGSSVSRQTDPLGLDQVNQSASAQQMDQAIGSDNAAEIRRLVEQGAELDPPQKDFVIDDPLSVAAWNGKLEAIKTLVELGDDLNRPNGSYGDTPLLLAGQSPENSREAVILLIESGADVNKPNSFGVTPFIMLVPRYWTPP